MWCNEGVNLNYKTKGFTQTLKTKSINSAHHINSCFQLELKHGELFGGPYEVEPITFGVYAKLAWQSRASVLLQNCERYQMHMPSRRQYTDNQDQKQADRGKF